MRKFSSFVPRFWITGTGRTIVREYGAEHALVAIYLFTSPAAHMGGLYHCTIDDVVVDTHLRRDKVEQILADLEQLDFIRYDRDAELMWVINMLHWQLGKIKESDNRIKNIETHAGVMPDSYLIAEFCRFYGLTCEGASKGLRSPLQGAPSLPVLSGPVLSSGRKVKKQTAGGDEK